MEIQTTNDDVIKHGKQFAQFGQELEGTKRKLTLIVQKQQCVFDTVFDCGNRRGTETKKKRGFSLLAGWLIMHEPLEGRVDN